MKQSLVNFFRKSLVSPKAILFEDANIQIGSISNYAGNEVGVRLFFGNRNQHAVPLEQISLKKLMQPMGFEDTQQIEEIPILSKGEQKVIDIKIKATSFALSIPVYGLVYRTGSIPSQTIPVRLPIVLLKFCHGIPEMDPNSFKMTWEQFG